MPAGFVGRAEEVRVLAEFLRRAGEVPSPAVAFVHGRPGAGKTRLLAEVCARAAPPSLVRLRGYEPESAVPLAAVRDLLRQLAARPGGALVQRLFDPTPGEPLEVFQVFEAAARALPARGVLTVAVDDLQWVDETSTSFLHYLVRAAESAPFPLTLLLAGRPAGASAGLVGSLARVIPDAGRLLTLELHPLDRGAGVRLARELAPALDERDAAEVWRQAQGSPFWIEALAREHGGGGSTDLLGFRLQAVSGDAATVLALLAVAGRPLDRPALRELVDRSPGRVERATEALVLAGLADDVGGALTVVHDLVRERVMRSLAPDLVRRVHRDLAGWLEHHADDDAGLVEAVEHGRRAGIPLVGAALRLAESPRRRLLGARGLTLLRSVAGDADPRSPAAADLDRATARLATELGDHELALASWSALARRAPTPALAVEAALAASECAFHLGRAAEAERFLAQAVRSPCADGVIAIEADARAAAVLLWLRHRGAEGEAAAERAVAHARRLVGSTTGGAGGLAPHERLAYLRALMAGAEAAILADRPADVLALTDEVATVAAAGDTRLRIRALTEGALAQRWLGRNADAEARLGQAWQEARAEALPQATAEVGALFAWVLYSRGRLTQVADVLDECARIGARLAEYCPSRAFSPIVVHLLEAARGDWRRAVEGLRSAAADEEDPHYRAHVHLERALVAARYDPRRQVPAVRADVRTALADAAESGCRRCGVEVRARSAEALARVGDPAAARELLGAASPDERHGNLALQWWVGQATAAVLAAEGAADAAVAAWTTTAVQADQYGMVLEALWARLDLGQVLLDTDRAAAAAVLREAGEAAEAMGAINELRAAEQSLRGLGVRTWRRAAGTTTPAWTGREREIARRVAAGASNADIAAALFLSRKTVERHVSNVLAKSGLRNRAELAASWSSGSRAEPGTEGVPR